MQRPCDVCSQPYEAKRSTSKYCSDRCRVAASRGALTQHLDSVPEAPVVAALPEPAETFGPVEAAAVGHLRAVERDATTLGQAALALARRVDVGRDTGAGLASLVKQLEATLRAATADVKSAASPVEKMRDELATRRAARGA